jgi:phosphoenolpyruvate carboxylase
VASFTNQTFVDQKEFILERYLEFAKELIDKLTPALSHTSVSEKLTQSIKKDAKDFPYISNIKPQEPYRAKLRYIIEKLENTLQRVREVKKRAGETIHPLLGQTLVGPSGYNLSHELQQDIDTMYASLLEHEGKAQARSLVQDFKILVDTFGFHLCSIDFRQTSDKNFAAVKEYLAAIGHNAAENLSKFSESDKQKVIAAMREMRIRLKRQIFAVRRSHFLSTVEVIAVVDYCRPDRIGPVGHPATLQNFSRYHRDDVNLRGCCTNGFPRRGQIHH